MLSKTQVKYIQSLFHKKFREEYGQFVIEGPKIADEAIVVSPADIINIYACDDWIGSNLGIADQFGPRIVPVSEQEMGKISGLHAPSNVLIVLRKPASVLPSSWKGLTVLLDGIQDPGNLGTIVRTADWFGVSNIICGTGTADCYNPKVIQSTMGSIFRVRLFYEDLHEFIVQNPEMPVVATSLEGEPLKPGEKWDDLFLVIGNESQGVQRSILEKASRKVFIPRRGSAESLNAAVAAGIILYALRG